MEQKKPVGRPKSSSLAEKEMDKVEAQFNEFNDQVQSMTMDRMNMTPKQDIEQQTKISSNEIAKNNHLYLKPYRQIGCRDKFNEDYRKQYEFDKEYVNFIAENKEIIGETIEIWTRPYGGMPAEWWKVPCNKPVWGPRYLAEQIKRKSYHRLVMKEHTHTGADDAGQYYGSMAVDTSIQRLDAHPVSTRKSLFMGSVNF